MYKLSYLLAIADAQPQTCLGLVRQFPARTVINLETMEGMIMGRKMSGMVLYKHGNIWYALLAIFPIDVIAVLYAAHCNLLQTVYFLDLVPP